MSARWLKAIGCLCCLCACAVQAQAQPTVQNFDGGGSTYALSAFGSDFPDDTQPGPSGKCCRIVHATGSALSTISFDRTNVGPVGHVVADFDFRIGGSTDGRTHGADGIGFVLLNTQAARADGSLFYDITDVTGIGPQISEEAEAVQSIGFGFDTWHNGAPSDPNDNHISVYYTDAPIRDVSESAGNVAMKTAVSLYPFGYRLHRNLLPDNAPFDHANITIDAVAGGANVSVTITPAGGAAFTPINNLFIPNFAPYEMRAAFGARTGGENDHHDIDNVNITYSP